MKIQIKLHPNSSQEKIEKISEMEYEVWLKEKPIDGKANASLVKFLKKYFSCEKVEIISGKSGRKKLVEIE